MVQKASRPSEAGIEVDLAAGRTIKNLLAFV